MPETTRDSLDERNHYRTASSKVRRGLNSFFCAQYINIGTGRADLSSSFFLPKLVGAGRAAEMCLTGERVPAQEAYRIGLANHVPTREDLLSAAKAMAAVMCSKNRFGLRMKALIIANAITEGAKELG